MRSAMRCGLAAVLCLSGSATASWAQLLVSANDGKVALNNGVIEHVAGGKDSVTIIDIGEGSPRIVGELPVANSVKSPPSNVAISPDGSTALIAAIRTYEGDPAREVSDSRVTFIDLRPLRSAGEPTIVATLDVGKGPAGLSINRSGDLALVANRDEGSVALLSMAQHKVVAKVSLGDDKAGPGAVAFTPDGTRALVSLYGTGAAPTGTKVAVVRIHDDKIELTDRMITTGFGPFSLDIAPAGDIAVVANLGGGVTGDADVVSVIDLAHEPIRVVNAVSVAPSPEGIKLSPDGRFLAVSSVNGTHKARSSPFYHDAGILQIFAVSGTALHEVAEAEAGHWCQGVAWSKDARRLYLQCMVEREIQVFSFDPSGKLDRMPALKIDGGPAGLAASYN